MPAASSRAAALSRDFVAAAVVSLSALSFYVSAASLLFQGPLLPHLPAAIGALLAGAVVMGLFAAWRGSLPLASAGAEPATVPVLATMTAALAAQSAEPAVLPNAVAALAVTGLVIGLAWWAMGRQRGGDLIRFIPYPVIGGFIASVGWLMLTGGLGVAMAESFSLPRLLQWLGGQGDARLAVALAIGLVIWKALQRSAHVALLPSLIVGAVLAVHAGLWLAGLDLAAARAGGWLLAPFSRTLPAWPFSPELLAAVQWPLVAQQAGLMLSAVIVATLSLLLSDTSLEVAWDQRADIDRDLQALGQGNLAAVAAGGLTGGISISRSMLNRAAGADGRASSVMLAGLCALAMFWGGTVISLVPRPLLGGVLIYLGLGMLKTWLIDSRPRLPQRDHLTIVAMVAVTALAGFLAAVCVGVLICCLDFALSSARLSPVRRQLARSTWPSQAERSAAQAARLRKLGQRWVIVELQGVLFFGSATQLVRHVEALLDGAAPPTRLLLDFRHVRWIDSSAGQALGRLFKRAAGQGVELSLSQLPAPVRQALASAGSLPAAGGPVLHDDIDAAVTAWDDEALADTSIVEIDFMQGLAEALPSEASRQQVLAQFERLSLAPGEALFHQGEGSDAMYLVRSGRLVASVSVADGEGAAMRELPVRSILAGGVVGEMGMFRNVPRSATVRAEAHSVVLRLQRERLATLEAESPALAAAMYRLLLNQMAGRIDQLTAQAAALAR